MPSGWKVYRGTRVPLVVAYPPDWSIDQTLASVGEISFSSSASKGGIYATIGMRSKVAPSLSIAVLRARFVGVATRTCESGERVHGMNQKVYSGITFATATAICPTGEEAEVAKAFYLGVALRRGAEWTFTFQSNRARLAADRRKYFLPMLRTLNIFANP